MWRSGQMWVRFVRVRVHVCIGTSVIAGIMSLMQKCERIWGFYSARHTGGETPVWTFTIRVFGLFLRLRPVKNPRRALIVKGCAVRRASSLILVLNHVSLRWLDISCIIHGALQMFCCWFRPEPPRFFTASTEPAGPVHSGTGPPASLITTPLRAGPRFGPEPSGQSEPEPRTGTSGPGSDN